MVEVVNEGLLDDRGCLGGGAEVLQVAPSAADGHAIAPSGLAASTQEEWATDRPQRIGSTRHPPMHQAKTEPDRGREFETTSIPASVSRAGICALQHGSPRIRGLEP